MTFEVTAVRKRRPAQPRRKQNIAKNAAILLPAAPRNRRTKFKDLGQIISNGSSVVIFVNHGSIEELLDEFVAASLSRWTPCLIILNISSLSQETYWTNLEGLRSTSQINSPSLLIIGEVARYTRQLRTEISALAASGQDWQALSREA